MSFTKVLAVVPVADFSVAVDWYTRLLGRSPDARPMPGLADWHITDSAWVQVYEDAEHSGSAILNLVVEDIAQTISHLAESGISVGEITTTPKDTKLGPVTDPAGNTVTLIENPSE